MSKREATALLERVTTDPAVCGGKPCIRGMRIRVSDVLDLLAYGLRAEQVVEELPDLELDDVRAAILYAASCDQGARSSGRMGSDVTTPVL